MNEKIVWIALLFVFGLLSLSRAFHYVVTPNEELYSTYRNTIDVSPAHFKKRMLKKRIKWVVATVLCIGAAFYLLFE